MKYILYREEESISDLLINILLIYLRQNIFYLK